MLWVAVLAIGLGLTAASGTMSADSDPTITNRSIFAWAVIGGVIAGSIGALVHFALVRRGRRPPIGALATVVTAAALGALIGIANTQGLDRSPGSGAARGTPDPTGVGSALEPLSQLRRERAPRPQWGDGVGGSIVLGAGLAMLIAAMVFFARRSELRERERNAIYLRSDLVIDEPDDADDEAIAGALRTSLAHLRASDDPRLAIRAAYGTLLDGLADIGLERRPYEAPAEYIGRCLATRSLPDRPIDELLHLFELARFSTRPITTAHAASADRALLAAIDHTTMAAP